MCRSSESKFYIPSIVLQKSICPTINRVQFWLRICFLSFTFLFCLDRTSFASWIFDFDILHFLLKSFSSSKVYTKCLRMILQTSSVYIKQVFDLYRKECKKSLPRSLTSHEKCIFSNCRTLSYLKKDKHFICIHVKIQSYNLQISVDKLEYYIFCLMQWLWALNGKFVLECKLDCHDEERK